MHAEPASSRTLAIEAAREGAVLLRAALRNRGVAAIRLARALSDTTIDVEGLPQHLLAQVLGMRPETLSRAVTELRGQGLVEGGGRDLRVVDLARLQHLALDGDPRG